MSKRSRNTRARASESVPSETSVRYANAAMCSAWEGERILDGFASIGRVEAELSKAQDNPQDRPRQFEKARHWFKYQWFIRSILLLRYSFFHFGFTIKGEGGKTTEAIKRWEQNNQRMYQRYARDAWLEWLVQDNVVGLWRQQGGRPPIAYPPENCHFTDVFGNEVLKIKHGIKREHITTVGAFSRAEAKELMANPNELTLDHDNKVFGFDVLRRERTGAGFGPPSLAPLFTCAAQLLSLEVGDAQLAGACRRVMEQHQMGHEIKSGIHAGSKQNFYKKERAQEFEKQTKGKTGHVVVATNFDHKVVQAANWPDAKLYDAKRYESGINRIALWSMPLGQMLLGKTLNPFLMTMLKFQAQAEREFLKPHLETVFIEALGAPSNISLQWSDKCFQEARIWADLMKTALVAGPGSQTSFLEAAGLDPEEERGRKADEAKLPKSQTTPLYEPNQGGLKKGMGGGQAGRKGGSRDGEGEG